MRLFEWFKDKSELIKENMKIKNGKQVVEQKFNEMLEDMDKISLKYVDLLEKKSEQFDLYLKYQGKCLELTNEKKELKRQLALANEKCILLTDENNNLKLCQEKNQPKRKVISKK